MKKVLSIVLTIAMLASMLIVAIPAHADVVDEYASLEAQYTANASAEVYYIEDAADFIYFWNNRGNFKTTIKMVADVDVNPGWTSAIVDGAVDTTGATTKFEISEAIWFEGDFDGQGHTLSGVYVEGNVNNQAAAIFGRMRNSSVKNLIILNSAVVSNKGRAGGLGTTVNNVNVFENILADIDLIGAGQCGGIVGLNTNGAACMTYLTNVVFAGEIYSTGSIVGGLVGYSWDDSDTIIDNCAFYGKMTVPEGAIAGQFVGGTAAGTSKPSGGRDMHSEIHISNSIAAGVANYDKTINGAFIGQTKYAKYCASNPTKKHYVTLTVENSIYLAEDAYAGAFGTVLSEGGTDLTLETNKYTAEAPKTAAVAAASLVGADAVLAAAESFDLTDTWVATEGVPMPLIFAYEYGSFMFQFVSGNDELYVYDEQDFVDFLTEARTDIKSGPKFAGKTIYIENDITLNDEWVAAYSTLDITKNAVPAPTEEDAVIFYTPAVEIGFAGTIEGQGHTIQGLYIVDQVGVKAATNAGGLFGRGTDAVIRDLAITNSYMSSAAARFAGLFSIAGTTIEISNCLFDFDCESTITDAKYKQNMASLIGYTVADIDITNTIYMGTLLASRFVRDEETGTTAVTNNIGGFVGGVIEGPNQALSLKNCAFYGTIYAPNSDYGISKVVAAQAAGQFIEMQDCIIAGEIIALAGAFGTSATIFNRASNPCVLSIDNCVIVLDDEDQKLYVHDPEKGDHLTVVENDVTTLTDASTITGLEAKLADYGLAGKWIATETLPVPAGVEVDDTEYLGYQVKQLTDGTYAIRFIGLGEETRYQEVGFNVSIEREGFETITAAASTDKVYSGLIVGQVDSAENGETNDFVAPEGKYVFTINVGALTADLGVLTFTLTTTHTTAGFALKDSVTTVIIDTATLPTLAGVVAE